MENKNSSARKPTKPKFDTALAAAPEAKPEGPPPMPEHVLLDPPVTAARASSVHAIAASPWAPLLAVTGQRQILLFDTNSLELAGILPFPEGDPVSLAFTPNARYLIVGGGVPGKSGVTVTFDVVTGERMLVAGKEFDSVLAADLKPDLSMIATGSPSRLIKIWKAEDGSQLHSIKKHTEWVTAVDFSPDGILLATGDRNGGVWVWEADSAGEFHTLRAHQAAITATAFRADSNLLASASEDGTVRFWEMNGGTEVKKIDAHPGGVLAFAWTRDGSFITAGRDQAVKLWKPDFNLLREFKDQPDLPVAVAFDADGKRAFAADYRGQISVWDIASGNPAGTFDANPPSLGQRLVSLREEIRKHPGEVAAAEVAANAAKQKLEEARRGLADAEAALNQSRELHTAAAKGRQEIEQRLARARQQMPPKKEQAARARALLDAANAELQAKREAIAAVDRQIATTEQESRSATAELKRLEDELAKARAESRNDAIAGLEGSIGTQRPKADAAAGTLEQARSDRARELGPLAELESRQKAASEETTKLDAEVTDLANVVETLPATLAGAARAAVAAEARIKELEAALPPVRDAIAPVEAAATAALIAVEQTKQKFLHLQDRERHWSAAAVNAEALKVRAEAERQNLGAESLVADFEALAKSVDEQSAVITRARQGLAELHLKHAELLKALPLADPRSLSDSEAGIAAARRALAEFETKLAAGSSELAGTKAKIDEVLPIVHSLRTRAEELKARYLALRGLK